MKRDVYGQLRKRGTDAVRKTPPKPTENSPGPSLDREQAAEGNDGPLAMRRCDIGDSPFAPHAAR
jgi:hypothetical protein